MLEAHEGFDFQRVSHLLNSFATVDLSSFYLDVSKDRLYTLAPGSRERRSAQTAIYHVADGLARIAAPIVPFMAEDVWSHLPGPREASVHLARFPAGGAGWIDDAIEGRWDQLIAVRERVNAALERARQEKLIGTALAASVTVRASGDTAALLSAHERELPMLFITSGVTLAEGGDDVEVDVVRAAGEKCPRCWRYVEDRVMVDDDEICVRCADALGKAVQPHG
jgi:isoleucyl-tRNA synthetase